MTPTLFNQLESGHQKTQSLDGCLVNSFVKTALNNQGITLQPKFAAHKYINNGKLIHSLPHLKPQTLSIYGIYHPRKYQSLVLRPYFDSLVTYFDKIDT